MLLARTLQTVKGVTTCGNLYGLTPGKILFTVHARDMSAAISTPRKIAVVLAGCGVYDGSEIHEASAVLVHLSRGGAIASMFAPDITQMHVIDHTAGEPMASETRNVLKESARIARGKIENLALLKSADYHGVIFPGGFGAAKNLSTFAVDGVDCKVNDDVERVLKEFRAEQKPIGMCCIAPVLAAKVLKDVKLTVGMDKGDKWPYAGTVEAVKSMGATHVNSDVNGVVIDEDHQIVTTPAYMCETAVHQVFDGIGNMVNAVLGLIKI